MGQKKASGKTSAAESALDAFSQGVPNWHDMLGGIIAEIEQRGGFAKRFVDIYESLPDTSTTKAQMTLKLMQLMLDTTKHFGETKPAEEMSDEELRAAVTAYVEQFKAQGEVPAPPKTDE